VATTLHEVRAMQTLTTEKPILEAHRQSKLERLTRRLAASDRTLPIVSATAGLAIGSALGRALRPKKHRKLLKARFASAGLARSVGAFALGVSATGVFAIGALAIGKLKIKDLDIDRLRVGSVVERELPLRPATT